MAEGKKGFILYADQKELFNQLPDDKAGQLIKHIFKYVNDEDPESDDLIINLAFTPIRQQLKRDLDKWDSERKNRSEAGKKGMANRWKDHNKAKQGITNDNSVIPVITKITDTVNVNGSVNDTVNVKEKKTKKEDAAKSGPPGEYKNICKIWFEHSEKLNGIKPKFGAIDGKNLKQIIKYISENQNEGQKTEDTFKYILDNWSGLESWLQQNCLDLKIFNQKINIIITQLKNGKATRKENNSFSSNFVEHLRKTDPNFKNY